MEPDRVAYSPIIERPPLRWPNGARVALWVCPNIEHYEYLPDPVRIRDPWPRMPHPDILGYGVKDYGNRVGLWRMFEVMDRYEIRCTVSLGLAVIDHYPEVFAACEERGWDYMCHGVYNTQYLWGLPEDEERAALALAESATRLADRPDAVSDEVWNDAASFFDERQLAALILYIATTNLFNRLNATTRQLAGRSWN